MKKEKGVVFLTYKDFKVTEDKVLLHGRSLKNLEIPSDASHFYFLGKKEDLICLGYITTENEIFKTGKNFKMIRFQNSRSFTYYTGQKVFDPMLKRFIQVKNSRKKEKALLAFLIKQHRDYFRISQEKFAKILGISKKTITRWESKKFYPKKFHIEKLRNWGIFS